jgi:hypothetical protein
MSISSVSGTNAYDPTLALLSIDKATEAEKAAQAASSNSSQPLSFDETLRTQLQSSQTSTSDTSAVHGHHHHHGGHHHAAAGAVQGATAAESQPSDLSLLAAIPDARETSTENEH